MSEANRAYDFENCRPYEELAAALVMQAVKNYAKLLILERKNPRRKHWPSAAEEKEELEGFFNSEWCHQLCGIEGCVIIDKVQRKVKARDLDGILQLRKGK